MRYDVFEIKPEIGKKVQRYKSILMYVNLPLLVLIPFAFESGLILPAEHAAQADNLYMTLMAGDLFLFGNSYMMYSVFRKMVTGVTYLKDEQKVEMSTSDFLLREKKLVFEPSDLEKVKGKTVNPMIGYRSKSHS